MKLGDKITVTGPKRKKSSLSELDDPSKYPFDAELTEGWPSSNAKFFIDTPFRFKWLDSICALSLFKYTKKPTK